MFGSGIPGLPRLIALRGLVRFFGFTFFAICYLLGLLAFQANPRLHVGSRHGCWITSAQQLCFGSRKPDSGAARHTMPNRDSSVTYALALKIAFHVSDMLPPARSLRTNRTRKPPTSHGASKWPRTPLYRRAQRPRLGTV
jgi:hypothetical protein